MDEKVKECIHHGLLPRELIGRYKRKFSDKYWYDCLLCKRIRDKKHREKLKSLGTSQHFESKKRKLMKKKNQMPEIILKNIVLDSDQVQQAKQSALHLHKTMKPYRRAIK